MRKTNASGYKYTIPGKAVYSKAGNYIEWHDLSDTIKTDLSHVLVSLKVDGEYYTFKVDYQQDRRLFLPLDSFFEYILAKAPEQTVPRVNLYSFFFYRLDGERVSGASPTVWFDVFRAAMPWGAEFPYNGNYVQDSFATPVQYLYPGLPYTFDVLVGSFSDDIGLFINMEVGSGVLTVAEILSGNQYHKTAIYAADIPRDAKPFIWLASAPDSMNQWATMPLNVDQCLEGYLVTWFDPSGVRKAFRFAKGEAHIEADSEALFYTFSDLGQPIPRDMRTARRVITLHTPYIDAEARGYVEGLARGTNVAVLDIEAWVNDNSLTATPAIVKGCEMGDNGQPLQTWSFTLEYILPSL